MTTQMAMTVNAIAEPIAGFVRLPYWYSMKVPIIEVCGPPTSLGVTQSPAANRKVSAKATIRPILHCGRIIPQKTWNGPAPRSRALRSGSSSIVRSAP